MSNENERHTDIATRETHDGSRKDCPLCAQRSRAARGRATTAEPKRSKASDAQKGKPK